MRNMQLFQCLLYHHRRVLLISSIIWFTCMYVYVCAVWFLRGILQFVYSRRAKLFQGLIGIVCVLNQLNLRCELADKIWCMGYFLELFTNMGSSFNFVQFCGKCGGIWICVLPNEYAGFICRDRCNAILKCFWGTVKII